MRNHLVGEAKILRRELLIKETELKSMEGPQLVLDTIDNWFLRRGPHLFLYKLNQFNNLRRHESNWKLWNDRYNLFMEHFRIAFYDCFVTVPKIGTEEFETEYRIAQGTKCRVTGYIVFVV